jgi:hypothetical protein
MPSQENICHITPLICLPPLRIGIFFDGTGNNDNNPNKYSNVKYLYDMHSGDDEGLKQKKYAKRKFYQRGVGSHKDDFVTESAMGVGAKKRFENVIFHIEQYIAEYAEEFNSQSPNIIYLDVFGFSRGAAMARHFVNCIKQNYFDFKDLEINKRFSDRNIKINFLGVFDTVGSFGIAGDNIDTGYSFYIDPNWIEKKAVHIYALHEYRWGFDLQAMMQQQDTNYPINIFKDKFIEIGLPGVHSDIGGGYEMNPPNIEQFSDNSLLACIALEKMAQYASENDVPLGTDYKDSDRRNVTIANKNFNHMKSSYTDIQPYLEDSDLRPSLGLWREQIALKDIYQHKREKTLPTTKLAGHAGASAKMRLKNIEKTIQIIDDKIKLSEQHLLEVFSTEQAFFSFKDNYRILYLDYMHRSHSPFNSTFAMGKQDADENFWPWDKTISDERPHRDIFYNQYKDFKKINNRILWHGNTQGKVPTEFFSLQSEFWEDETRDKP